MKKGEILDKVYKSNLPSRGKQIMFYFINRANAEGTCFPSVGTIATDCSVAERTVQRTMKVLLEEGFIIKENRYRDNGGQSSNLYKLQIEPENNIHNQNNNDKEKIKVKKVEVEGDKKDNLESIEIVTFHDYIEAGETKTNILNSENKTSFNIVIQNISQGINCNIKPECHPILFQQKLKKLNNFEIVTLSSSRCHGVGDNLYPP